MRFRDGRRSVCISSQLEPSAHSTFCATADAVSATSRSWEILDQALHFRCRERIDDVVFMGMGEPMLNVDAVFAAARRLPRPRRHATPRMQLPSRPSAGSRACAASSTRSARSDPARPVAARHPPTRCGSQLMPVNDRYPLDDVLAECSRYVEKHGRKVFVEYVMLAGVNDSDEHATELAALLDRQQFKVNLIPDPTA